MSEKSKKACFLGRFQDFRIVVTAVPLSAVYVFDKYTAKFALAALGRQVVLSALRGSLS
ncbi:hypothetical protein [Paraburkholderia fynbosensis]|uniref:hypothetical protein n=1 Tax=Paraburkholderia fynbosensis TaxID=1200993 RepID=UPI001583BE1D|nr:hypothetical protein [Paraburkholderia fynbosensis]